MVDIRLIFHDDKTLTKMISAKHELHSSQSTSFRVEWETTPVIMQNEMIQFPAYVGRFILCLYKPHGQTDRDEQYYQCCDTIGSLSEVLDYIAGVVGIDSFEMHQHAVDLRIFREQDAS